MLTSLALVFLLGMLAANLCGRLRLPGLTGMILAGMAIGPYALGLLDDSTQRIAPDLRQLALVIILTRVGLALDLGDLKKVGRPAILLSWLPAALEILGVLLLAPRLLGVSPIEAAIIGAVLAAVSPAVIVPRMLHLMEAGYGRQKAIPQMLMAGASVDDIFVIVLFTAFTGLAGGGAFGPAKLLAVPLAVVTGVAGGLAVGLALAWWFRRFRMRDSAKVLLLLSISFLLIALEKCAPASFSGLLAVICIGLVLLNRQPDLAKRLAGKFSGLWVGAEVLLFVLVGATVDLRYAVAAGLPILALVCGAQLFRAAGVQLSLVGTGLTAGERWFCTLAYLPKATVQAAIGAIPLGLGLACGQTVLAVAVVSILLTAPLGALAIDLSARKLLAHDR